MYRRCINYKRVGSGGCEAEIQNRFMSWIWTPGSKLRVHQCTLGNSLYPHALWVVWKEANIISVKLQIRSSDCALFFTSIRGTQVFKITVNTISVAIILSLVSNLRISSAWFGVRHIGCLIWCKTIAFSTILVTSQTSYYIRRCLSFKLIPSMRL